MKRKILGSLISLLIVLFVASPSMAAFWLQPSDMTIDSIQQLGSNTYMVVSWNSGSNTKFYQLSPGLAAADKNKIIASALTIKSATGDVRLHINNSGQVDGIDYK